MKIIMTLCVRDEEDIIRHNIEFHRALGVDMFLVTDNLSQDCTKSILKEYEQQGILEYFYSDEDTHSQYKHVTKMARHAYAYYNADWVINNDADEFWFPVGHDNLKDVFRTYGDDVYGVTFNRQNFVPLKHFRPPFYDSMVFKQVHSVNWLGQPLPGKAAHRGHPDTIVRQGNHAVTLMGDCQYEQSAAIDIMHFTARQFSTWEASIIHGGRAYRNNTVLPRTQGIVRRTVYAEYERKGNLNAFYEREFYSRLPLLTALLRKRITIDTRLKRFMHSLYEQQ